MSRRFIAAFGEDAAHRMVVGALIAKVANEEGVAVRVDWRSARGGHPRVSSELREYLRDLTLQREQPDLVVVATDANCKGAAQRTSELPLDRAPVNVVLAMPDPHIERWLLVDGAAFKSVLGHGCAAPDQKCARDRYKGLLLQAVIDAGVEPSLGGIEYAEDLVAAMDLERSTAADASLRRFVEDLRRSLRAISRSSTR